MTGIAIAFYLGSVIGAFAVFLHFWHRDENEISGMLVLTMAGFASVWPVTLWQSFRRRQSA